MEKNEAEALWSDLRQAFAMQALVEEQAGRERLVYQWGLPQEEADALSQGYVFAMVDEYEARDELVAHGVEFDAVAELSREVVYELLTELARHE